MSTRQKAYEDFKRDAKNATATTLLEVLRSPESEQAHAIEAAKELLNQGWGPRRDE